MQHKFASVYVGFPEHSHARDTKRAYLSLPYAVNVSNRKHNVLIKPAVSRV